MNTFPEMMDINARHDALQTMEIMIRKDGQVVWVNLDGFCVFRVCGLDGRIIVYDEREKTP